MPVINAPPTTTITAREAIRPSVAGQEIKGLPVPHPQVRRPAGPEPQGRLPVQDEEGPSEQRRRRRQRQEGGVPVQDQEDSVPGQEAAGQLPLQDQGRRGFDILQCCTVTEFVHSHASLHETTRSADYYCNIYLRQSADQGLLKNYPT